VEGAAHCIRLVVQVAVGVQAAAVAGSHRDPEASAFQVVAVVGRPTGALPEVAAAHLVDPYPHGAVGPLVQDAGRAAACREPPREEPPLAWEALQMVGVRQRAAADRQEPWAERDSRPAPVERGEAPEQPSAQEHRGAPSVEVPLAVVPLGAAARLGAAVRLGAALRAEGVDTIRGAAAARRQRLERGYARRKFAAARIASSLR